MDEAQHRKTGPNETDKGKEVNNTDINWWKAKTDFEKYKKGTNELEAGQGQECEDFATRMVNQAKLKVLRQVKISPM